MLPRMDSAAQVCRLPQFTISGLGDVRNHSRQESFSHVVSIWDTATRGDGPDQIKSFFPASRFYLARFDDIETESDTAVTKETVRAILEFGSGLSTSDKVLVHCLAGVSRSSSVAFALACQFAGPGNEAAVLRTLIERAPWIKPNRRVVQFADALLRRDGRMVAAVGVIWAKLMRRWASLHS